MYGENNRTDVYDKVVKKTSDTMLEYMSSYVYTGKGQKVSKSVVSVQVHPSVTEIENNAFRGCTQLKEVVFNTGLRMGTMHFMGVSYWEALHYHLL